jgi:hypothetical protein
MAKSNDQTTKWQDDQMAKWPNDQFKWPDGEMAK